MKFKYPKLALLTLAIILAYILFRNPTVSNYILQLHGFGYLGFLIAGMLFAFGFSAPFATGFFIISNPQNILAAGVIAGFGALVSDLLIFNYIRFSFMDEFELLKEIKIIKRLSKITDYKLINKIKIVLLYITAIIIIASPLPDEAGIILLAGLTKVNQKTIAILGFVLNTLGIIVILSL